MIFFSVRFPFLVTFALNVFFLYLRLNHSDDFLIISLNVVPPDYFHWFFNLGNGHVH